MKIFSFYKKIDSGWLYIADRTLDGFLLADDIARYLAWFFRADIKLVNVDDDFSVVVRCDEKDTLEKIVISLLDDVKSNAVVLKCKRNGPDTPLWACPSEYDALDCEACKFHYYE